MNLFGKHSLSCQVLNGAVKEVLDSFGGNGDHMIGHRVHTQRAPNLRDGCGSELYSPLAAAISYLIGIEPAHAHEQFIGQKQIADLLHRLDRAYHLH